MFNGCFTLRFAHTSVMRMVKEYENKAAARVHCVCMCMPHACCSPLARAGGRERIGIGKLRVCDVDFREPGAHVFILFVCLLCL